jgi:hypothetical protein
MLMSREAACGFAEDHSRPPPATETTAMRYTGRGLLVLSLVTLLAAVAGADDLTTAVGKKLTGSLVGVDKDGVTFKVGEAPVKISGKEIVFIDLGHKVVAPAKDAKYQDIELTDGSRVRCSKFLLKGKKFDLDLLPGPEKVAKPMFDLPLASVSYAMRGAEDAKRADEWKKLLATRGKRDLYVQREREGFSVLTGTVVEGNAAGTALTFEKEDGKQDSLLLSRATGGLVFAQPQPASVPPTLCRVNDVFGNTLVAQAVEMSGAGVKVTTVSGVVFDYPSAAGIAQLDYARGNVAYLSDLTPQVNAPEVPADELNRTVREPVIVDRGPAGAPLRLDGTDFTKGLWVSADTVLTYTIGGEYRELKATVGVPDQVADGEAQVKVTVEADGRVLFSDVVRRKDKPKGLSLDVKNVKQVRIQVESESSSPEWRQVVIADARVQK